MIKYSIWDGSEKELYEYNNLLNSIFNGRKAELDYFYWKHIKNPLGKSIIVFAKLDEKIIGARALQATIHRDTYFMQPCDTVTHPDFQRKGIFSSLTKLALTQIDREITVINFPNLSSLPANLKSGWEFHQTLRPNIGLNIFKSIFLMKKIDIIEAKLKISKIEDERWRKYCEWRFISNPKDKYSYFLSKRSVIVVNENRMSYCINFLNQSSDFLDEKNIPFLCYSYISDQKFNFFEKSINTILGRGSNIVSRKSKDYLFITKKNEIELSGLMDTF